MFRRLNSLNILRSRNKGPTKVKLTSNAKLPPTAELAPERVKEPELAQTAELAPERFEEEPKSKPICYPEEEATLKYDLTDKNLDELRKIYVSMWGERKLLSMQNKIAKNILIKKIEADGLYELLDQMEQIYMSITDLQEAYIQQRGPDGLDNLEKFFNDSNTKNLRRSEEKKELIFKIKSIPTAAIYAENYTTAGAMGCPPNKYPKYKPKGNAFCCDSTISNMQEYFDYINYSLNSLIEEVNDYDDMSEEFISYTIQLLIVNRNQIMDDDKDYHGIPTLEDKLKIPPEFESIDDWVEEKLQHKYTAGGTSRTSVKRGKRGRRGTSVKRVKLGTSVKRVKRGTSVKRVKRGTSVKRVKLGTRVKRGKRGTSVK